jgi:hypothetical protein
MPLCFRFVTITGFVCVLLGLHHTAIIREKEDVRGYLISNHVKTEF